MSPSETPEMRTAGVIGGLGPETTSKFYLRVVLGCQETAGTGSRPPVLIWNVPISYSLEKRAIEKGTGKEELLGLLVDAAKRLERGGADFIVIPCNTVHVFIGEIRAAVSVPVLSIVEETARFLKKRGIGRVGVLATPLAYAEALYDRPLEEAGIRTEVPRNPRLIGRIISRLVTNDYGGREKRAILSIMKGLEADTVLLACTDLQLVIGRGDTDKKVYDTMEILAEATVRELLRA